MVVREALGGPHVQIMRPVLPGAFPLWSLNVGFHIHQN